jgi:O-antigen/teichoic acid export membrane protein
MLDGCLILLELSLKALEEIVCNMAIAKDSLINFVSQIVIVIFSFIASIILARSLGPEGKGIYFLAFMIATTSIDLVRSSMATAGVYYLGIKKYRLQDFILSFIFLTILLAVIGIGLVLFFFKPISFYLLKNIDPFYVKVALLFIPLNLLFSHLSYVLVGLNDILKYNLVNIINKVSFALFIGVVCLFWRNITLCIIANLVSQGVAIVAALFFLSSYWKGRRGRLKFSLMKDVLIYGWKAHFGNLIFNVVNRLDSYLIKFFLGATFLGYYSVAIAAENIWSIPIAIGIALFPKVSLSLLQDRDKDTAAVCRQAVFLTSCAALILFILSRPLIKFFYGEAFLPAVFPMWILLPGIASLSITKTLKHYFDGTGRPLIATYSAIVTLFVCVILNFLLIPRMGILGAALATTISYIVYATIILIVFLKLTGNKFKETVIIKKDDFAVYRDVWIKICQKIKK